VKLAVEYSPGFTSPSEERSPVYKVVWFARMTPELSKDEAFGYWAANHGPLCATSGIERYVQNHVTGPVPSVSGVPEEETYFDGYSCGWWSSKDAYEQTMASPEWQALVEDGDNVFDMTWLDGMSAVLREYTIMDGPQSPFKVLWMVRFRPDLDRDYADRYWLNTHGAIFKSLDIDRYVQNHVVESTIDGASVGFDGFSECWFKDEEQFLRAVNSAAWAEAVEDGLNVFDMSQLWGAVVKERVVKDTLQLAQV
jgi:uncharacterized protein (TIGR02118 family)